MCDIYDAGCGDLLFPKNILEAFYMDVNTFLVVMHSAIYV